MATKMFYSLDEAKAALGKNEEEIKQLAREGRLREFRDGPRLMFKADQVEAIKAELGGGGPTDAIDISDTGAPIGLVDSRTDSRGASGTGISLADSDVSARNIGPGVGGGAGGSSVGGSQSAIALAGSGTGMPMKEDTALAADLGLSGSMGGVPSPGRLSSGMSLSGTHAGHRSGITIFSPDEAEHADPSAQTNISSGVSDQVNLEGVGSGSGLLDLTRESDDTSLGAELLDEIGPGGSTMGSRRGVAAEGSGSGSGTGISPVITTGRPGRAVGQPVYIEAADPLAPAFGGAALGAALFMLFAAIILMSGILGANSKLAEAVKDMKMLVLAGIGAGAAILFGIVGFVIGKTGR
jgi:hypothetical protein